MKERLYGGNDNRCLGEELCTNGYDKICLEKDYTDIVMKFIFLYVFKNSYSKSNIQFLYI